MASASVEVGSQTPQKMPQNVATTNGHHEKKDEHEKKAEEHEEMQYLDLIKKIIESGE